MPEIESQCAAHSTGVTLHETITEHAQQYVNGEDITSVHTSLSDYADGYRGDAKIDKNPEFEVFQRMRIIREASFAAVSKIACDSVIEELLAHATSGELDIMRMTRGISPTYCDGVVQFLDNAVDRAFFEMAESDHPYHDLFEHTFTCENVYLSMLKRQRARRVGAMATIKDAYSIIVGAIPTNYQNDVASFLALHGISIQDSYSGNLPDADTMIQEAKQAKPHWLELARLSRVHAGQVYYGEDYKRICAEAEYTGDFPNWVIPWTTGLAIATRGGMNNLPFAACPRRSALLRRTSDDPIVAAIKSPARCAGQHELFGSPEVNEKAVLISSILEDNFTEAGRYSSTHFLISLGITASKVSYGDPAFRRALIEARKARDGAA